MGGKGGWTDHSWGSGSKGSQKKKKEKAGKQEIWSSVFESRNRQNHPENAAYQKKKETEGQVEKDGEKTD